MAFTNRWLRHINELIHMKVILHSDDFGLNKDTLDATIECFEKGALTSASIMVNCDASEKAFEYAREHPEFSFGVHLTFVDGLRPMLSAEDIPSLVDKDGLFLTSDIVCKKAMLLNIPKHQVIAESQAQINEAERHGVRVSHLDSHGHLHKFPSILYCLKYLKLGGEPVKKVRATQNIYILQPSKTSPVYWLNKYFDWFLKRQFRNPQYFYMSANNMDTGWADAILTEMDKLPQNAIIEIGVHPGHKESWRQHEYNDIIEFATKLRASGKHEVINWNQV